MYLEVKNNQFENRLSFRSRRGKSERKDRLLGGRDLVERRTISVFQLANHEETNRKQETGQKYSEVEIEKIDNNTFLQVLDNCIEKLDSNQKSTGKGKLENFDYNYRVRESFKEGIFWGDQVG